jgi:hypothetical protein
LEATIVDNEDAAPGAATATVEEAATTVVAERAVADEAAAEALFPEAGDAIDKLPIAPAPTRE